MHFAPLLLSVAFLLVAFIIRPSINLNIFRKSTRLTPPVLDTMSSNIAAQRSQWRQTLEELPSTPNNIPAFFLAHGRQFLSVLLA